MKKLICTLAVSATLLFSVAGLSTPTDEAVVSPTFIWLVGVGEG